MIRPLLPTDVPDVVALAVETGMFSPEAGEFLSGTAEATLAGERPGAWLADVQGDRLVGVAFYEPREATDRTWFLTMLAVAPDQQGTGRGRALVAHVEDALRADGQRLLLIETSGTEAYAATRGFYARCGYAEVARVPSYVEDGDDMVLFLKDLR